MATAAVAGAAGPSLPPELLINLPPDCRVRHGLGTGAEGAFFCTSHKPTACYEAGFCCVTFWLLV